MTLTAFDYTVAAVLLISALLGAWRGIARELFGLVGWALGAFGAFRYCAQVAALLPTTLPGGETARLVLAFILIFVGVVLLTSLVSLLMRAVLKSVGLSAADRTLGLVFGTLRGVLIVLVGVTLLGLTALPQQPAWRDAVSRPAVEGVARISKAWLPPQFADWLKF